MSFFLDFLTWEKRVIDGGTKVIEKYRFILEKNKDTSQDLWRLKIYQKQEEKLLFKSKEYSKKEMKLLYRNITNLKDINRILKKQ
ncbi:MAG: hypothetical protein JSV62_11160 [Promethearchaeota archaeon]|nr:MAG: hypothetical protein JSV62_11160 [Candidatus Lokiarchaeota archaeon]